MNPDINITGIRLETNSLILRPFKKDDLKDFNEYAKIPGVGEMAGRTHHESIEESSKILDMFINGKKTFAIIKKETGKVIGSFGIENIRKNLLEKNIKI